MSPGSRKRALLLAVAALLCVSALLAVAILLFGRFGRFEARILGTTGLLAGFGVLGLPAALLLDRRRLPALAAAVVALDVVAAGLALAALWSEGHGETLGRAYGTAQFLLLATAQTAALAARRRSTDSRAVRLLFRGSVVLAAVAAALLIGIVWAQSGDRLGRVAGALVVLDVLAVALQPILALAGERQPARAPASRL